MVEIYLVGWFHMIHVFEDRKLRCCQQMNDRYLKYEISEQPNHTHTHTHTDTQALAFKQNACMYVILMKDNQFIVKCLFLQTKIE